ncbi:WhiB family transcriptional regulator [Mycolicibacterium novocastrense]|uniref:Transcriptional regulator WhiB n=1 Tax=Mycolicibacterium novocastrense TaxID=59813 RepID=A0AAW5SKC6_MYCNV|nr:MULTISPECIES: WhiB family transcriptional regulator [Mycolicibacterium]MCV7023664.1 WhiB family transcriptional regulator [Mycolicibacterium novocastrense]MDX1886901.1 WhiB family transcriptional regulator [Mycolicibacterium sp. 120270]GAT07690.1 transcriptional regulator WhiB [Mycolicibacterium novocastrense]
MTNPCTADPELFFGGHTEYDDNDRDSRGHGRGGPTLEMRQRAAHLSAVARTACLTRCPLAQQRTCAQIALDTGATYGVWAGVQLPGGQTRKIPVLNAQREILAGIADGSINPRTHPSNARLMRAATSSSAPTLLAPRQGRAVAAPVPTDAPAGATA